MIERGATVVKKACPCTTTLFNLQPTMKLLRKCDIQATVQQTLTELTEFRFLHFSLFAWAPKRDLNEKERGRDLRTIKS